MVNFLILYNYYIHMRQSLYIGFHLKSSVFGYLETIKKGLNRSQEVLFFSG